MTIKAKRAFCVFLIAVLLLNLLPVLASASADDINTISLAELRIFPKFGGNPSEHTSEEQDLMKNGTTNSIVHSVMLDSSDNVVPEKSFMGAVIKGLYYEDGKVDTTKEVIVAYGTNLEELKALREDGGRSTGNGSATLVYTPDFDRKTDELWFFGLFVYDSDNTLIKSTFSSISVNFFYQAMNNIKWQRTGMQVRVIDQTPLGKYDYLTGRGETRNVANSNEFKNVPYFEIKFGTEGETFLGNSISVENLNDLYAWLKTNYIEPLSKAGKTPGSTFTLSGPSIVNAYGNGKSKDYLLAYYKSTDRSVWGETGTWSDSVNNYASWGARTKSDFDLAKYVSIVVNSPVTGGIAVECYDIDHPETLLKTDYIEVPEMNPIPGMDSFYDCVNTIWGIYADGMIDMFDTVQAVSADYFRMNFSEISEKLSTIAFDASTNSFTQKANAASVLSAFSKLSSLRDRCISSLRAKLPSSIQVSAVTPPEIKGYTFDFGYGLDMLTNDKLNLGAAVSIAKNPTMNLLLSSVCDSASVKLYYKAQTNASYQIKVRIDGVIDESKTLVVPAKIGDVVAKEDVDTSKVPDDHEITSIENVPLTVSEDHAKNIIIIDCSSELIKYSILYYLDNVFKESDDVPVGKGTTVTTSTAPIHGYPGYKIDHITGLPATISRSGHIVCVYLVSSAPTISINSDAKFYLDNYRTAITTTKSGYGVYGLVFVDVADLVNARTTPTWTVPGGCSPAAMSKTVNTYEDINVTVTATYMEGAPVTEANKNGHKVTVTMVKDAAHSTATRWAFRFPINSANQAAGKDNYAKAYIPINWKDKSAWTVTYNIKITAKEYHWSLGSQQCQCSGHRHVSTSTWTDSNGKTHTDRDVWYTYHNYTVHPLNEWREDYNRQSTINASILINGNMYEDDFSGRRS